MKPCFFTLFKRGMFYRPGTAPAAPGTVGGAKSRGAEEAERFAAAAIAFTFHHDKPFRRHFWNTVCQFKGDPSLSPKAEIQVEPYRWADLLLVNSTGKRRYACAIEFKIHAPLMSIQNPARKEFAGVNGYATLLEQSEGASNSRLRYVVLGWPKKLVLKKRPSAWRVKVQQRQWHNLASGFPQTCLAKDLAMSLGILGIGAFPAAEVATMKMSTRQTELSKGCAILREARRRLNWPASRGKHLFESGEGAWCIGTYLPFAKVPQVQKLSKRLAKRRGNLAWFGYEGDDGGPPQLAVYFYCGTRSKAENLCHTFTRRRIGEVEPLVKEPVLRVGAKRHGLKNDCDWFCAVFNAVGIRSDR